MRGTCPSGGVRIEPHAGLITDERGGTATFTAVLTTAPTADVTLTLTSSNTSEGTVSPASLTFTPANWNAPQPVTVTGVDDGIFDGPQAYTIQPSATSSTDSNYAGRQPIVVQVTNAEGGSPQLTPATLNLQQGSSLTPTLATVSDAEDSAGSLAVTLTSVVPTSGAPTIGTFTNTNGVVKAPVSVGCGAPARTYWAMLDVADSSGNHRLSHATVNVASAGNPVLS